MLNEMKLGASIGSLSGSEVRSLGGGKSSCHLMPKEGKFFFRFNNGGFGSKWMGLWDGKDKILDYWAYRFSDNLWLAPEIFSEFSGNIGAGQAEISYSGGDFSENCEIKENGGRLEFSSRAESFRAKGLWEIELGVNLRGISENMTTSPGKIVSFEKGVLKIASGNSQRAVEISGLSGFSLKESFEKRHSPGSVSESLGWKYFHEEEQNCLVVRLYGRFPEKTAGFSINLGNSQLPFGKRDAKRYFGFPENVSALANASSMASLSFASENGYFAGFPYFTEFWTRDACISIPALSRAGEYSLAGKYLGKICKDQRKDGCIPNFVGKNDYSAADTTPLFILASVDFWKWSGGREIQTDAISSACGFFDATDSDSDGFSETDRGSSYEPLLHWTTWMDSIERSGKAIEIQLLWGEALRQGGIFLEDSETKKKGERLISRTLEAFQAKGRLRGEFLDTLGGFSENALSSNILFGLAFSEIPKSHYGTCVNAAELLETDEFTSPWGVRTASAKNGNFEPSGYHKGAVWNLTTSLMSLGEFRLGRPEQGKKYLEILAGNLGRRCFSSLDELYDGDGNPQGAVSQAWSSALVPRILDDCVFGISPDPAEGTIQFSPKNLFGKIGRVGKISGKMRHLEISAEGKISLDGKELREGRTAEI